MFYLRLGVIIIIIFNLISLLKTHSLLKIINNSLIDLPSPSNISTLWNFGSLLGVCLILQIVRGLFLAIHYSCDVRIAFNSVSHISRDVILVGLYACFMLMGPDFFLFAFIFISVGEVIMNNRGYNLITSHSYCFFRICFTLRSNVILRGYRNYLFRGRDCLLIVGRVCGG